MKKSPLVLALAALLFIGWMIFLGSQALRKSKPVVVSRAQLLVSQYEVEVDLQSPPSEAAKLQVVSVLYKADDSPPSGEITVTNLGQTEGYAGPGAYLLPLVRHGNTYEVPGYPDDPGFVPDPKKPLKPRIYPLTDEVRRQHRQIRSL